MRARRIRQARAVRFRERAWKNSEDQQRLVQRRRSYRGPDSVAGRVSGCKAPEHKQYINIPLSNALKKLEGEAVESQVGGNGLEVEEEAKNQSTALVSAP